MRSGPRSTRRGTSCSGCAPGSFGNAASGTPTPTARVVVDGTPRVGVGALAEISAMMVREIRYLNAADASIQFGTGYDGGAILVFTR